MNNKPAKHTGENHQGDNHSSPYPVSRLAPQFELVDLAQQISEADAKVNIRVNAKLKVIAEQIKALQDQAKQVLLEAEQDQALHQAACHFTRIPGKSYHLYKKPNGSVYFSMLSPEEWHNKPPHEFINTYRLENDMSWTPAEKIREEEKGL